MARIPDREIETLKREVSIERLAEGCSFRKAVEILRGTFSPLAAVTAVSEKVSEVSHLTELKSVVTRDGDTNEQLRHVLNFYTATLKESPDALAYLKKRGIDHAEAIEVFRLGFANRTLGYHIPATSPGTGSDPDN